MQPLSERDKKIVRLASIGIAVYLALFIGIKGWKKLEKNRSEYQQMLVEAEGLKREVAPLENKFMLLEKLKEDSKIEVSKISRATVVADTSAAIQKAAQSGGIKLGPLRESSARTANKELASVQIEGVGQIASIMAFCHQLESLGYPLAIETFTLAPQPGPPGMLKMNMTVALFDWEQWKTKGGRNA
ncbi:MAG: hypothetical protein ACO1QB_09930 [Verrucomicrobiales bacterium]